jgi:TetR/AcrR family transcriptional regulator, repressor for neighboring sulfatase
MTDRQKKKQKRRGREATTAAILDAAEELFSTCGYDAVAVRDIAERAGVSHPIVHTYVGSKAEVLRAVLARDEGLIATAAPANPDLIDSASLMFRHGLGEDGVTYLRLVVRSALDGLPYDRTPGRFEGTERLIELAEQAAASAPPVERTGKDLEPRLVIAAAVALFLGWAAAESWIRPAAGLQDMDDAELIEGLERVVVGILRENVSGVARDGSSRGVPT